METLAHTPEKTNNPAVMFKQEGIMDVSQVDDSGNTPLFEARVKNDRSTSPNAFVRPERGVYGLEVSGENFADEPYKYSSHNAAQNRNKLKRTARNAEHSPLVTFGKDGVAYYAGIDSPYSIVVLTGEPGEAAVATQLKGDGKAGTGVYMPNGGDRIYIVETALADHMVQYPADERTIHDDYLLADVSSYAYIEVKDEFALNMAYNAKSAAKSNSEKLTQKRTARAQTASKPDATPDTVVDTTGSSTTEPTVSAGTADTGGPYNVYDPEARVGSEMPYLDTELVEDSAASSVNPDTQAKPARQVFPINEPLATSAPSASAQARERMRQSRDGANATPAAEPRFTETDRYKQARDAYEAADQEFARGVAARTKLGMFARKKTREASDREIAAQEAAYERTTEIFDTIQMEKWISNGVVDAWKAKDPSLTDDQINERIAQKLANYHTAKQRLHNLHTQSEFRQQKGKFGKLSEWNDRASEWYAGLGKKEKIAASIGATVVGGALGVVAAPLGIIGGAGVVAAKVWKTSMQTRSGLYEGPQQVDTVKATDGGRLKTTDEMRREFSERMAQTRTGKIENADRINRRARYATLASAAFLGAGILSHVDVVRDAYQGVTEQLGDWWNGNGRTGAGAEVGTGSADPAPSNTPEVGGSSNTPTAEVPAATTPAPSPEYQFSSAARTVVAGEGFYNTFAEMGITNPAEQASLLQKVGPELVVRGIAYPMADGTYGISRPGALSQDVLELIQKNR